MNHDFCPWANRYVYWLKKPVGWIITGALFSLLVGLMIGPQGFVLMWSFIAFLLLGVAWPWLSMKGVSCRLSFAEERSEEGEPICVNLEIRNRWPVPIFGLTIEGNFLQDLENEDDLIEVGLKKVPALSVARYSWSVNPARRGLLPGSTPEIATGFPFGLYRASKEVEVSGRTIVWPLGYRLKGVPDNSGIQFNVDGSASDRPGNDGEVIALRGYRHGDTLKSIHWAQTARFSKLIVRERQTFAQTPIQIVLDLDPDHHWGNGSKSTYEWAIRAASSVAQQLHAHQSQVEIRCGGLPKIVGNVATNRRGLNQMMDFLATLPEWNANFEEVDTLPIEKTNYNTNSRLFVIAICTNKFPDSELFTHRILVDSEGYVSDGRTNPADQPLTDIVLTPEAAADSMTQSWQEIVHAF